MTDPNLNVLMVRLGQLRQAIADRDWAQAEFQFDRVQSVAARMAGTRGRIYDAADMPVQVADVARGIDWVAEARRMAERVRHPLPAPAIVSALPPAYQRGDDGHLATPRPGSMRDFAGITRHSELAFDYPMTAACQVCGLPITKPSLPLSWQHDDPDEVGPGMLATAAEDARLRGAEAAARLTAEALADAEDQS